MRTTLSPEISYQEAVEEYRIALRLWAETRALYGGDDAAEVREATHLVEDWEHRLLELHQKS